MITLILKVDGSDKRFCFKKRSISLGPKECGDVDIPLPVDSLETPFSLIEENNGRYTIQNLANDPRLRFNGLPFGKRTIAKGSTITFQHIRIVVESVDDVVEDRLWPKADEEPAASDIKDLIDEVERLEWAEHEKEETEPAARNPAPVPKTTWIASLSVIVLLILGTFFATVYFSSNVKTDEEELKAAQGVSDAAVALLYANLHHIKPPNRNWADPEFLNQILSQVVPKTTTTHAYVDAQGRFRDFPYILRVYTNEDASRFVLLAQPESGVMSWFSPKNSIVIDSSSMTLKRIQDVQPLNRLIFNVNQMNKGALKRIAALSDEGTTIPLDLLDYGHPSSQFAPPQELKMLAPGAQNLVYNAPRYYKLTAPILSTAAEKNLTPEARQEFKRLMKIPHLVFYTTEGVKTAVKSYKNLSASITTQQLLVGYFAYHPKTHLPAKTELLVVNQPHKSNKTQRGEKEAAVHQPVRLESELYQTMTKLGSQRKQVLRPIAEKINDLLYENSGTPQNEFKEHLVILLKEYEKFDLTEQRRISRSLKKLYKRHVIDNQEMSGKQFLAYLKATGLSPYVKNRQTKKQRYNPLLNAGGSVRDNSQASEDAAVLR